MMSDDVVEILKAIQAQFGGMDIMIRDMSHQITGLEVGQQRLNDQITVLTTRRGGYLHSDQRHGENKVHLRRG